LKTYFEKWRSKVKKPRVDLYPLAQKLIESGMGKTEVAKELMKLGVPRSTAYRWINRIEKEKLSS